MTSDPTDISCPSGWQKYQNKCFHIFKRLLTYSHYASICSIMGSTMITIHSEAENDFIHSLHSNMLWLGAVATPEFTPEYWADGTPIDYKNWAADQPKCRNDICGFYMYSDKTWRSQCSIDGVG